MGQLIEDIFHAAFDNDWLRAGNDQSAFEVASRAHGDDDRRLCRLADLLPRRRHRLARRARHDQRHRDGGRAAALSLGELHHRGGLRPRRPASASPRAWGEASRAAGVPIITGDTKVVERGKADGVFISTTGVGVAPPGLVLSSDAARPGDVVVVFGHDRRPRRRGDVEAREPRIRDPDPLRFGARCTGWSRRSWRRAAPACG